MESTRKKKKEILFLLPTASFSTPSLGHYFYNPLNWKCLFSHCLMFKSFSSVKAQIKCYLSLSLSTPQIEKSSAFWSHQVSSLWVCLTALSYHCPGHACVISIHDILSADAFLEGMVSIWPSTRFSHTWKGIWQMLREMFNKCIVYTWMIRHSHTELIWVIQPISFCHKVCSHSYWDLNTSSNCYRFFSTLIFLTLVSLKTG